MSLTTTTRGWPSLRLLAEDALGHGMRKSRATGLEYWLRVLQIHDPATLRHSYRVRQYALRLADAAGLDSRTRMQLATAGMLHDLGKVGVPRLILNKPGRLTVQEFEVVQRHPVIGEQILAAELDDAAVLSGVRSHHERIDGGGYPDGLRGERIPLLARILALADCYDALRSSRPYRAGMSTEQALEVLRQGAGTQFESELTALFLGMPPAWLS